MVKNVKIGPRVCQIFSDDDYLVAVGDDFEPPMVQLFSTLLSPEDVVADIGANIGLTSLLFSTLAKRVYAFEPSPSTYQILLKNLSTNKARNVEPVNIGLGDQQATLTITFAKNNRSGGFVSTKICPKVGHVTEEIEIDTIDNFFAHKEPVPSFLKIDVEGFEINVIQGARDFLKRFQPTVVMEMNHFCLNVLQRITLPDFLDFMRTVFPYLYAVDNDNMHVVDLHNSDQAYLVMHEHVVRHRYQNLVAAFDQAVVERLKRLQTSATKTHFKEDKLKTLIKTITGRFTKNFKKLKLSQPFGSIELLQPVNSVKTNKLLELPVRIINRGNEIWHGSVEYPVYLSYHWFRLDGSVYVYDGLRTPLQKGQIAPGQQVEQNILIMGPSEVGTYRLVITLVQEGVFWFEDRGFDCVEVLVEAVNHDSHA